MSFVPKIPMSPVNFRKIPCRPVEFKKRQCRPVDFRGLDPSLWSIYTPGKGISGLLYFTENRPTADVWGEVDKL